MTTPPADAPEILDALKAAGDLRREAERLLDVARQEMYDVVDRAVAAGVTYQAIADAIGLTKGMVAQIVRRNDEEGG